MIPKYGGWFTSAFKWDTIKIYQHLHFYFYQYNFALLVKGLCLIKAYFRTCYNFALSRPTSW